ncbi:hypothetical protein DFH08DRAFT_804258 [Mycena albidolilacea]|uniref:Uncharacterized protein n=1 Tax=Mycena albidolilacea TaxID=1033008 RepID=A0AAD7ABK0_9AGAR|nr:hypothetical protein DFH08DRAFT_804258 [Mycena albidolilacea]
MTTSYSQLFHFNKNLTSLLPNVFLNSNDRHRQWWICIVALCVLDLQLAWHRRAENLLPKGTTSEVPMVSKLTSKALKRDALIAAVGQFVNKGGVSGSQDSMVEEEEVEDDVDRLSQDLFRRAGEHKATQNRGLVGSKCPLQTMHRLRQQFVSIHFAAVHPHPLANGCVGHAGVAEAEDGVGDALPLPAPLEWLDPPSLPSGKPPQEIFAHFCRK